MLFHPQYKECPKSLNSKVYLYLNFPEKNNQGWVKAVRSKLTRERKVEFLSGTGS